MIFNIRIHNRTSSVGIGNSSLSNNVSEDNNVMAGNRICENVRFTDLVLD